MRTHPIQRNDGRVKFAHEILSNVIDAVLVMALVHLWYLILESLYVWQNRRVVVLPNVVQAVYGVGA